MKKIATFTSGLPPVQTPTHYRNRDTSSIMWLASGAWNRICKEGTVTGNYTIKITPESYPERFEPLYGPLTITLNFDEGKE